MSTYLRVGRIMLLVFLAGTFLIHCGPPGESGGNTLSGVLESPTGISVPDGTFGYMKLVASGGPSTDSALYWTQTSAFSGGSASYEITGIPPGTYSTYAMIDMNAHAPASPTAMPDPGDYHAGKPITVPADTMNVGPGEWSVFTVEDLWTYVGTWVNPGYDGGSGGPLDPPAKWVMTATLFESCANVADTILLGRISFGLNADWTEPGYHYFNGTGTIISGPDTGTTGYFLIGVSNNNSKLEITSSPTPFPTSLANCLTYSRQ